MPLVYVTGSPGVGKSTIDQSLREQGLESYDIDTPRFGGPYSIDSGESVTIPPVEARSDDWFSHHEWRINSEAIAALKKQADSDRNTVFLCGVAEGDEAALPSFDKIIYLAIEDTLLLDRLMNRTGNDFGKSKKERKIIIERKKRLDERYTKTSVNRVDASQPISKVTEDIIKICGTR